MSNHFEGLGKTWLTLLNDPEKEVPAVVMQVMKEGKTRDCWHAGLPRKKPWCWPGR